VGSPVKTRVSSSVSGESPGGLTRGAAGDVLVRLGHLDGHTENHRREPSYGLGAGAAAEQSHPVDRHPLPADGFRGIGQQAEQPLHGRAGEILTGQRGEGHAEQAPGGVREVRGALSLEIRDVDEPFRPGWGCESEGAELLVAHAEHGRSRVENAGSVQRTGEGEVGAGGVREAGDQAAGIRRRRGRDCGDHAGGADGDRGLADLQTDAQRARGVVAASGAEDEVPPPPRLVSVPGLLSGPEYRGQANVDRLRLVAPEGERQQVTAVLVVGGIEVARPGRIRAIGGQRPQVVRAADAPGQPVVGQGHCGDAARVFGFVIGKPPQLRHGQGSDRH